MKLPPPPLRFLALVVGGWVCIRAAMLLPGSAGEPPLPVPAAAARALPAVLRADLLRPAPQVGAEAPARQRPRPPLGPGAALPAAPSLLMAATADPDPGRPVAMPAIPLVNPVKAPSARRWSLSAWLLVRDGDRAALAAGGLLGGSQAGARLTYRLNEDAGRPLSLSLRLYAPLDQPEDAEIALGAEWQPLRDLPLRLLAERRQAIGRDGRSAFSALVHVGVSEAPVAGPIRLDAYGQAGMVGLRSRDLFADGSVQLSLPLDGRDRVRAGAGAWGAVQPGAARLDLGPQLTFRLPARAGNARLAAGWRFRVAGDAAPASGPVLSVSTAF